MENNLIELQDLLRKNKILISFSGRFYQEIIEELGEAIKKHMEVEETPKSHIYNVFAIFIEQSQNIRNYTIRKEGSNSYSEIVNSGIVSIGKTLDGYFIYSGNLVDACDIPSLTKKLDLLKTLNKDELKKLYKDELKKDLPEGSLGAGVGLIDIARKSSEPLEYSMQKINDDLYFFQLKAIV